MNNQPHAFRAIHRPEDVQSSFSLLVVDGTGRPHLPLTTFYHRLQQQLSDGTARSYLNSILPFFSFLASDEWRQRRKDKWNSPPDAIQESVRDYLMHRLGCKVQPKSTYVFVKLTAQSPTTVRLFLAALKRFYTIMSSEGSYPYLNPLLDTASRVLREVEQEERAQRPRMPQCSGVEEPVTFHPSENFFRVAHLEWEVHPVDDPTLGKHLIEGFAQAGLSLRDQIVIRMALETGARIREILTLTIDDSRIRGMNQEAKT